MYQNTEVVIKNYSGLSTEEKPTNAAGGTIPNGSRWREVDTGRTYFYELHTDSWYPFEVVAALIAGHAPVVDLRGLELLEQMAVSLKKIEYHLMLASDADLKEEI